MHCAGIELGDVLSLSNTGDEDRGGVVLVGEIAAVDEGLPVLAIVKQHNVTSVDSIGRKTGRRDARARALIGIFFQLFLL